MVRDNVFMIIDKKGTGIGQMFHHNNNYYKCKTHACGIPYKINLYISVVYRQCVGIPMGGTCAPLLANLFLIYYMKAMLYILVAKKHNPVYP